MALETTDSGERFGPVGEKYEILQKVGEGGMATVYRGRHRTLDREVAIKILHPHLSNNVKNRTRFEREARAIESLDCRNIPEIYDFSGPHADQCYIITEFIHGPTLRTFLERVDAVPSEPAALIGLQIANALDAAHHRGIIHRDIKPENIMIDPTGIVMLMDFGIARVLDEAHVTLTGALVGSPAFMSPEQARDDDIDPRSDIFSFGTLMYLTVTGELPFRGGNPSIMLKGIIEGRYEDPIDHAPDLHPDLVRLIERCLETDPEARYANIQAVRADLEKILTSSGIDPHDPGELWSLASYFHDSEGYERRLRGHLVPTLLDHGKTLIDERNSTEALRHLNRVLTLDEGNPEVLDLIGRLGGTEDELEGTAWWPYALTLAGIVALVGVGLWWQLWRPGPNGGVLDGGEEATGASLAAEDGVVEGTTGTADHVEEVTDTSDRSDEITPEEPTPEESTPEEATDTSDRPEDTTQTEEQTPAEEVTTAEDGITEVEDFTPPPPPPLERWEGESTIHIVTPNAPDISLYYRDRKDGPAIKLHDECMTWVGDPVPITAGRLEVWAEGPFHKVESRTLEIKPGVPYKDKWILTELPAHVIIEDAPDGTTVIVDGNVRGRIPGAARQEIPVRREVRVIMRAPDGTQQPCNIPKLQANDTYICRWE